MKLTGAIFDLDGTLLDSMPYWASVGTRYLEQQHIAVPDVEQLALRIKTMTLPEGGGLFSQRLWRAAIARGDLHTHQSHD